MQKVFFAFSLMAYASLLTSIKAQDSYSLTISFTNVSAVGDSKLYIQVLDESQEFTSNHIIDATKGTTLKVPDLKKGRYFVRVFQDLNNDGELSTNYIGIPNEPYGFSNNVRPMFGPPKTKDMLFLLDKDMEMTIELK